MRPLKRKRMIKLLMSVGVPRNKAVFYADLCGGEMPHRFLAVFAITRPDLCDSLWELRVRRAFRNGVRPKLRLVRDGKT